MIASVLAGVLGPWDISALFIGAVLVILVFRVSRGRAFSISAGPLKAQVDEIRVHAETAVQAAQEAVVTTTKAVASIGESVGPKNGHGTLQDQLAALQKNLDQLQKRHGEFEADSRSMHTHIMTMAQRASNEEALHAEGRRDMTTISQDLHTLTETVRKNAEVMEEAMSIAQHNQASLVEQKRDQDVLAASMASVVEDLRAHYDEDMERFSEIVASLEKAIKTIGEPDEDFVAQGRSILGDIRKFHHEWANANAGLRGWSEVLYTDLSTAREQQKEFSNKVEEVLTRLEHSVVPKDDTVDPDEAAT